VVGIFAVFSDRVRTAERRKIEEGLNGENCIALGEDLKGSIRGRKKKTLKKRSGG